MKTTALAALAALLAATQPFAAARAADNPRFTREPTVTREGDSVKISFTLSRPTDVAVYVLDQAGNVVRHLAGGVLGKNPPSPLKAGSLAQSLVWDGKDDDGRPAKGGPFRVRVLAGMRPAFDGFLLANPDATTRVNGLAVGPKGNVCAFYQDPTANGNQGGLKIKLLDRGGHGVRMLMPHPADLPYERVKALGGWQDEQGRLVPHIWNWHTLSFYPDPQIARRRSMSAFSLPAVDAGGRVYWIVTGPRLAALDADGGIPFETFLSEPLTKGFGAAAGPCLPALAVSGDGKSLYLSGLGNKWRRSTENRRLNIYDPFPAVFRIDLATRKAKPFLGKPGQPGKAEGLLTGPRGLAVADGLVYVADPPADRVAVFKEDDGRYVGELKVRGPHTVSVDPKTTAVYVCAYTGAQTADLVKFDGYKKADELYRVSLPKTGLSPNGGTLRAVADFTGDSPRLWVPGIPYGRNGRRLSYYEDTGKELKLHDLSTIKGPWANGPRDLLVDRRRGDLYVKVSGEAWYQFEEKTGKLKRLVKFPKNDGAPYSGAHGAQLGVDSAGNYITHCWGTGRGMMRWTRDLKPMSWEGQDTHRTQWGGMMTFQLNYMTLFGDRIYLIKPTHPIHLRALDMGLKVKRTLVWNVRRGCAPRVDAKGNIYLTAPLRPLDRDLPAFFDGKLAKVPDYYRNIGEKQYWYTYMYASIVKFPPEGGAFHWLPSKRHKPDFTGLPKAVAARPKRKFHYFEGGRFPHKVGQVQGAEWVRFGYSPYSETYPAGTPVCMCEGTGFDVDPFGRVFYPNLCQFRVEVIDTNNNPVTTFGHYGNQDSGGPKAKVKKPAIPLAWPTYVAVSDTHAYVNDTINMRVVKVKLDYAARAEAAVP